MTPKEKAKHLHEKFMTPVDTLHNYPMCYDTSKQCALLAVNEIISDQLESFEISLETNLNARGIIMGGLEYWKDVKIELEEL